MKDYDENKPAFFVPLSFDIAEALNVNFSKKHSTSIFCNQKYYFQNSDKAPFIITKIIVDDIEMWPITPIFIGSKQLFAIKFNREEDTSKINIFCKGLNGISYSYLFNCSNHLLEEAKYEHK